MSLFDLKNKKIQTKTIARKIIFKVFELFSGIFSP
jgi:hypothetical protein